MLDLTGNLVNTFGHKDLIRPEGICTDGRGQVFVCRFDSDTVFQLSPKHQKIKVMLKKKDGLFGPQGVYFDRKNSRLLVPCRRSNELFSFIIEIMK